MRVLIELLLHRRENNWNVDGNVIINAKLKQNSICVADLCKIALSIAIILLFPLHKFCSSYTVIKSDTNHLLVTRQAENSGAAHKHDH
jgi:hypothetical protein